MHAHSQVHERTDGRTDGRTRSHPRCVLEKTRSVRLPMRLTPKTNKVFAIYSGEYLGDRDDDGKTSCDP